MMKKLLLSLVIVMTATVFYAQTVYLYFSGRDTSNRYVRLEQIQVKNLSQGWQETLYWPDTVLQLHATPGPNGVETWQSVEPLHWSCSPNPCQGNALTTLRVQEAGDVTIDITDMTGRVVESSRMTSVLPGSHQLDMTFAAAGIYFLIAKQNGKSASVKIVNQGNGGKNGIKYHGLSSQEDLDGLSPKGNSYQPFHQGDQMEYIGYATINGSDVISLSLVQEQSSTQFIKLYFAFPQGINDGFPCKRLPYVYDYDGNVYNTVQIGNQCWTKENLRSVRYTDGTMIPLGVNGSNTDAYRYYPNNDSANVALFGYFYNWPAVMHGANGSDSNPSGVQGICPEGWHVPSIAEWQQLDNYVRSQSQYFCNNNSYNTAKAWASTNYWNFASWSCAPGNNPSTNNATGFSILPAGVYNYYTTASYSPPGSESMLWSTTLGCQANGPSAQSVVVFNGNSAPGIDIVSDRKSGFSVRCVLD